MSLLSHTLVITLVVCFGLVHLVDAAKCLTPSVRKEWRSLSILEKSEWIKAVKVTTLRELLFCG